jgi:hypothetical protein
MLAVAVTFSFGCVGRGPSDVKVHAVVTVGGTPMLMFTNVYRADAAKQTVVFRTEGAPGAPMSLENCAVRDAFNWRCEERGAGGTVSGKAMVDGRYEVFGAVQTEGWKFLTDAEWKALPVQKK